MRIGVIGHKGYKDLPKILETLFRLAASLKIELSFEDEILEAAGKGKKLVSPDDVDAVITLGGDGTLLRAARWIDGRDVPILGVNLGRLGFLTSCGSDDIERALKDFVAGNYSAEPRMALSAVAMDGAGAVKHEWRALNDVALHKGGFARVVRLKISIDGGTIGTYAADGIVISTPTGSTGYSLSAGGPVVVPTVESIIITPISAHTLAIRPLVIPPGAVVTVEAADSPTELLVTVDGQVGTRLIQNEKMTVRRAKNPVRLVRFKGTTFFERLMVKLGWGGLPERDQPR
jgi:NAD+ kinase